MGGNFARAICWVRRDLRVADHAALAEATSRAAAVAVVFVFDTVILDELKDRADRRVSFIHASILELDAQLRSHGSKLIVLHGDPTVEIPRLAARLGAQAVFAARDYEPYAKTRDVAVAEQLSNQDVAFVTLKDSVLMEGGEVLSQEGKPLRVFTPYKRAWMAAFQASQDAADHVPKLDHLWTASELPKGELPTLEDIGFQSAPTWLTPGEDAARARLDQFEPKISAYGDRRNFPGEPSTSTLSVDLRFGTLSVRAMARAALSQTSDGASTWLSEIIWRDFYQDILHHAPHVVETTFQPMYRSLEYPGEEGHFAAWCRGETGYPLVDAAMRCLNETGWMHNRLRMVVASFLTKDLLIDYRRGEAYFAEKLLDFDLASNNGGWQWAASVGADPQPYFRIFNPILQSEKFDPEGRFIKTWLPELAPLEGSALHFPARATEFDRLSAGVVLGETYPFPIVDHMVQKARAVALLDSARTSAHE